MKPTILTGNPGNDCERAHLAGGVMQSGSGGLRSFLRETGEAVTCLWFSLQPGSNRSWR